VAAEKYSKAEIVTWDREKRLIFAIWWNKSGQLVGFTRRSAVGRHKDDGQRAVASDNQRAIRIGCVQKRLYVMGLREISKWFEADQGLRECLTRCFSS